MCVLGDSYRMVLGHHAPLPTKQYHNWLPTSIFAIQVKSSVHCCVWTDGSNNLEATYIRISTVDVNVEEL